MQAHAGCTLPPPGKGEGMQDYLVKEKWEEFQAIGRVPDDLRGEIAASWQRSAIVSPAQLKQAPILTDDQLDAIRKRSARFMRAALPAVQRAGNLLHRSANMILLCDPDGIVIDQFGDPATMDRGYENNLALGGRWSERDIGTNAIGIALQIGRPVQVIGAEHYSQEIHRWSCSATPVRDPVSGRLLGVVNVSWPAEMKRSAVTALSALLGHQAEIVLGQQLALERSRLAEIGQQSRIARGPVPLAVLDRNGQPVIASGSATNGFPDEALAAQLGTLLPDLLETAPEQLEQALTELESSLDVEVVCDGDDPIGLILGRRGSRTLRGRIMTELDEIAAIGQVMRDICVNAKRLAQGRVPLLIEGEAGVGKTTLAMAMHRAGPNAGRPFEVLDCSVLTDDRLRAEMGPGGLADRLTLSGGTLCLDRPGAASPEVQKLLPALLERLDLVSEVRIVALCVFSLYEAMTAGQFPGDLYFRLAGARLSIPPLRERRDEMLPTLRLVERKKWPDERRLDFTASAQERLIAYHWPGNLREMENLIGMLRVMAPGGRVDHRILPREFHQPQRAGGPTLRDAEHARIIEALDRSQGNLTQAARRLGIARSTLYLKMDSYGISRPQRG